MEIKKEVVWITIGSNDKEEAREIAEQHVEVIEVYPVTWKSPRARGPRHVIKVWVDAKGLAKVLGEMLKAKIAVKAVDAL